MKKINDALQVAGYTEQVNDAFMAYTSYLGLAGAYNDRLKQMLELSENSSSVQDMYSAWDGQLPHYFTDRNAKDESLWISARGNSLISTVDGLVRCSSTNTSAFGCVFVLTGLTIGEAIEVTLDYTNAFDIGGSVIMRVGVEQSLASGLLVNTTVAPVNETVIATASTLYIGFIASLPGASARFDVSVASAKKAPA